MSWIPTFETGVWNAWLLMLFFPLQPFILMLADRLFSKAELIKKLAGVPEEQGQVRMSQVSTLVLYGLVFLSIFLPLRHGTPWLTVGLSIYLLGLVIFAAAVSTAARTPMGTVFTGGIYHYSRHPLYLSSLVLLLGVSMASASWIFLLLAAVYIYLSFHQVAGEEQACLAAFGSTYQAYMDVTPRWIGIPRTK